MKTKEEILDVYVPADRRGNGVSEAVCYAAMRDHATEAVEAALKKVEDILEAERIAAVKLNSHAGSYAEQVLYNVIEEVRELYPTPPNI